MQNCSSLLLGNGHINVPRSGAFGQASLRDVPRWSVAILACHAGLTIACGVRPGYPWHTGVDAGYPTQLGGECTSGYPLRGWWHVNVPASRPVVIHTRCAAVDR